MTKSDIEKAAKYLSDQGYGRGSNYTTCSVANLMAEYANMDAPIEEVKCEDSMHVKIVRVVENHFNIKDIRIPNRHKGQIYPRHICRFFLYTETDLSLKRIGDYMGISHSSVLTSARKMVLWSDLYEYVRQDIDAIYALLEVG